MRIALATLTALALTFGAFALARGDEAAESEVTVKAFQALRARVDALQAEVGFLRSREEALRTYVLANDKRGQGLEQVVTRARAAGFEARTIPEESRRVLMDGLLAAAQSIRAGLPNLTPEESKQLLVIKKLRGAADMGN